MAWLNADGLYVKFGTEEADIGGRTGIGMAWEYAEGDTGRHVVEIVLDDMTLIPSSAASGAGIVSDTVTIPNGAFIDEVVTICHTVVTGSSSTLNVGLVDQDRSTELDYDGFIAAAALTTMDAAGETTTYVEGSTAHGALLGTALSNTGLISVDYDTAAFTAGKLRILIKYRMGPVT